MAQADTPEKLSLGAVAQRCAQESDRFFRHEANDARFCFELFRRAILERNTFAWDLIYRQYQALVTGWVRRHPAFAPSGEDAGYFVNRAFEKMWVALTPDKFSQFPNLPFVLRYFQMCVFSVLVDHSRAAARAELEVPLDALRAEDHPAILVEDQALNATHRLSVWDWLAAHLHDEKERRVVYGSFVLDLKPRELQAAYSHLFPDVDAVYQTKQNVLARLRRDPELRALLVHA